MHTYIYLYTYIHVYVSVCMYVYIYMYMHDIMYLCLQTHTHTYIYSRDRESEQDKMIKNYVLNKLESKFNDAARGSYSDYISVYYFMTALILDIFLKILQMDGTLAVASIAFVFSYIWVTTGCHSKKSALQSCDTKKKIFRFFFKCSDFFFEIFFLVAFFFPPLHDYSADVQEYLPHDCSADVRECIPQGRSSWLWWACLRFF